MAGARKDGRHHGPGCCGGRWHGVRRQRRFCPLRSLGQQKEGGGAASGESGCSGRSGIEAVLLESSAGGEGRGGEA